MIQITVTSTLPNPMEHADPYASDNILGKKLNFLKEISALICLGFKQILILLEAHVSRKTYEFQNFLTSVFYSHNILNPFSKDMGV